MSNRAGVGLCTSAQVELGNSAGFRNEEAKSASGGDDV